MDKSVDVFISYAHDNYNEVKEIVQTLEQQIEGLTCFFDVKNIESGDDFTEDIQRALDNSKCILFMASSASIQSLWVRKEVTYAKNIDKRVVPILLKTETFKDEFLELVGNSDYFDADEEEHMSNLISYLAGWIGKNEILEAREKRNEEYKEKARAREALEYKGYFEKGNSYFNGSNGCLKDYNEAFFWYERAAKKNEDAQFKLGMCYLMGYGCEKNQEEAVSWFSKSAKGSAKGCWYLGWCYQYGKGVDQDYYKAFEYYKKSTLIKPSENKEKKGFAKGFNKMAECLMYGMGVEKNCEEAIRCYKQSAEQGDPAALLALGNCYNEGIGVSKSLEEAKRLYEAAANKGHVNAWYVLADWFLDGLKDGDKVIVKKDENKAFSLFKKAADAGYAPGFYKVAECLYKGIGCMENKNTAIYYYMQAAQKNNENAKNRLEELGININQNPFDICFYCVEGNEPAVQSICDYIRTFLPDILCHIEKIDNSGQEERDVILQLNSARFLVFAFSEDLNKMREEQISLMKKITYYAQIMDKKIIPMKLSNDVHLTGWFLFEFGIRDIIHLDDSVQVNKMMNEIVRCINGSSENLPVAGIGASLKSFSEKCESYSRSLSRMAQEFKNLEIDKLETEQAKKRWNS